MRKGAHLRSLDYEGRTARVVHLVADETRATRYGNLVTALCGTRVLRADWTPDWLQQAAVSCAECGVLEPTWPKNPGPGFDNAGPVR
jgi:hypothetical protein